MKQNYIFVLCILKRSYHSTSTIKTIFNKFVISNDDGTLSMNMKKTQVRIKYRRKLGLNRVEI